MKKMMFAILIMAGFSFQTMAQQNKPKVIVLLNRASWCPICQANGMRFQSDIMPMAMKNPELKLVMDDLSDKKTKAASLTMLGKAGVGAFARRNTITGELYFLNARSKRLISKISIAEPDQKIEMAMQEALKRS